MDLGKTAIGEMALPWYNAGDGPSDKTERRFPIWKAQAQTILPVRTVEPRFLGTQISAPGAALIWTIPQRPRDSSGL